jgi:hypothetical protein
MNRPQVEMPMNADAGGQLAVKIVEKTFLVVYQESKPSDHVSLCVDWPKIYSKEGRWDVVRRASQVAAEGLLVKVREKGWQKITHLLYETNDLVAGRDAFTLQAYGE